MNGTISGSMHLISVHCIRNIIYLKMLTIPAVMTQVAFVSFARQWVAFSTTSSQNTTAVALNTSCSEVSQLRMKNNQRLLQRNVPKQTKRIPVSQNNCTSIPATAYSPAGLPGRSVAYLNATGEMQSRAVCLSAKIKIKLVWNTHTNFL